ncbi:MAG: hypothetical protein IH595_12675 [Bacteroidales bacterium]|nr:hypothetical protein [Bacteroidales bacterium]
MIQEINPQYQADPSFLHNPDGDKLPFVTKWNQLEAYIERALSNKNKTLNAIDILLQVSRMLANHSELHYTNYNGDQEELKKIYDEDLQKRIDFASEKIGVNFEQGQQQNIYRQDISREFVARSYARRMIDLHNPKIYPPQKLNYKTIYHFMFEDFLLGITNQNGLKYLQASYQVA